MKKLLFTIIAFFLPLLASADIVEVDGIFYNIIKKVKTAEVTSNPNKYSGAVNIPDKFIYDKVEYKVISIGDNAFKSCFNMSSVTIPNSVTSIGREAFRFCSDLTTMNIPNSVTSIGYEAFMSCKNLVSVIIPNSVTSISNYAFSGCSSLKSVTIPNSVSSISGCTFKDCISLTSVNISNSVTFIDDRAFSGCSALTSITIPGSVNSIFENAFSGCSSLTSVVIPNNVTYIDPRVFEGCTSLVSLTIGENISDIKNETFANCPNLADVYCLAENVPNTCSDAFMDSYIEFATLHVPAASLDDYINAEPWKKFKNKVALEDGEIPETPKCTTPTISFENGEIIFNCDTEGVEYVSSIAAPDAKSYYDGRLKPAFKYKVTVYATKSGYDKSDTATAEIEVPGELKGDLNNDGTVNVADHVELTKIIMNEE